MEEAYRSFSDSVSFDSGVSNLSEEVQSIDRELEELLKKQNAKIKVIGVGGGGGNAIEYMLQSNIDGVEFICANTDAQALKNTAARSILQLGMGITKGLGAGANPEVGKQSALEDKDKIKDMLEGADMVFITAGMGGGTGTGAAPVVAEIARELGILTVAVVTKPFPFEGRKRMQIAEQGIENLGKVVDSLITIPNAKLLTVLGKGVTLLDAFKAANDVLLGAVQGIADLITRPGLINVDFADVRTVMSEMGIAMMGTGIARGENRARIAAEAAISSPLLDDINLSGARGVLVNITAGLDMSIAEFEEVGNAVKEFTSDDATVIVGTVIDHNLTDELRVTLVATGLGKFPASQTSIESEINLKINKIMNKGISAQTQNKFNQKIIVPSKKQPETFDTSVEQNMDYLDIPAFLRRQAD